MEGVDIAFARSYDEAFGLVSVAFKTFDRLNDRVGELLRTNY